MVMFLASKALIIAAVVNIGTMKDLTLSVLSKK